MSPTNAMQLRKATQVVALVIGVSFLTSCATIAEDPVKCGVIGSVIGGVAGGALGTAFQSDNVAGPVILGTTLGASIGAVAAYQICKYPTVESAAERDRKRRARKASKADDDD